MLKADIIGRDMSLDVRSCSLLLSNREHRDALRARGVGPYAPRDYVSEPKVTVKSSDSYSTGGNKDGSR